MASLKEQDEGAFCDFAVKLATLKVHPSAGGYYLMPDFEVVRPGLGRRGLETGQDWCDVMLKEAKVAVRRVFLHIPKVEMTPCKMSFIPFKYFHHNSILVPDR